MQKWDTFSFHTVVYFAPPEGKEVNFSKALRLGKIYAQEHINQLV